MIGRIRYLTGSVLGHFLLYLVILAYCVINSSVFNALLLLLLLLDIFHLRTWKDISTEKEGYGERKQSGFCKDNPSWQTLSRTDLLLETEPPSSQVEGDESPYTWFLFFPSLKIRSLFLLFFSFSLLVKLFFSIVSISWLQSLPLTLRKLVYLVNGGLNAYPAIVLECAIVIMLTIYNSVRKSRESNQ